MGRYTLSGDDDSENSESEHGGNYQWDDGDVVMQDAHHASDEYHPDDDHDGNAAIHEQDSPRPHQSSLWSRALTNRSSDHREEDHEHSPHYESSSQETTQDELSSRMGPSHSFQLVGRSENGDLVPFHYHVYGGNPSPRREHDKQSIFTSCGWMLISLIAVLAHICYWYGPSVPPPDDATTSTTTNWHEFMTHEATVAWELMIRWGAIAQYVGYWCLEAMSREASTRHWYQSFIQQSTTDHYLVETTMLSSETIQVLDCHAPWRFDTNKLQQQQLHGQEVAIGTLSQILEAEWNFLEPTGGDENELSTTQQPHRVVVETDPNAPTQQQRQHPLLFYVIGGPAVGKRQLAKSLARQFLGKDCSNHDAAGSSVLLELNSGDHDHPTDASTNSYYELVWNHAMDHPNGSIVLWPVDETDRSKKEVLAFLQDLYAQPDSNGTFDKMIIFMTSGIGNSIIHKVLRKYGISNLPLLELESFLRYELQTTYYSGVQGDEVQESTKLFSKVHILTMLPLDRSAMRAILLHRLQDEYTRHDAKRNFLHVPDNAMDYLLDHGLEWKQWIHAKTEELLLEYCPNGARGVDPLVQRIASSCSAAAAVVLPNEEKSTTTTKTTTTLLLLDPHMGKFEMITCPKDSDTLDGCNIDCHFVL